MMRLTENKSNIIKSNHEIKKNKRFQIKLDPSTILVVALIGFSAALFYYSLFSDLTIWELISFGIINGLTILFSVFLHELMHSIIAKLCKLHVSGIEINLFIGTSQTQDEPKTPSGELAVAAAGPISNLLLGIFLLILPMLLVNLPPFFLVTSFYSGISNIGLAILNLIPVFPLDGGRISRALRKIKDNRKRKAHLSKI